MAKQVDEPVIDVEARINDLDQRLQRLRSTYEQYFLGIEKRPPHIQLKAVVRIFRELEGLQFRNTALKFRLRSLTQRFYSFRTYWQRTEREIENGTYKRHRKKAKKRQKARKERVVKDSGAGNDGSINVEMDDMQPLTAADLAAMGMNPDDVTGFGTPAPTQSPAGIRGVASDEMRRKEAKLAQLKAQLGLLKGGGAPPQGQPQQPGQPRQLRRRQPRAAAGQGKFSGGAMADNTVREPLQRAGLSQQRLQTIYRNLVDAKRQCNQSTTKLSYDKVVKSIAKQVNTAQSRSPGGKVDFKVVIKNGKAYLKPDTK